MNRPLTERAIRQVKLISLLSGKGGVGKSVLAFNLGERLAAEGYRVLLVDADLACGNLHILANAQCGNGYADFINETTPLYKAAYKINNLLDLLPSATSILEEETRLPEIDTPELLSRIRSQANGYDLVLIDHSSGVSKRITETATACDTNLLVIAPELTSIADGYGLYKRLITREPNLSCRFLINRSESVAEGEQVAGKFLAMTERFLGRTPDFAGVVVESKLFKSAVGRQLPLAAIEPQSTEIQALKDIAGRLAKGLKLGLESRQPASRDELNMIPASADTRG